MDIERLIYSISELERLKTVERGLNVGNRKESTAEHSWSCMLLGDILIDLVDEPLDRLKVMEFLLYHDLVEVYAGDAKFNNIEELKVKKEKEDMAMQQILSFIPNAQRYSDIISDYESKKSREAKFAKAIDCLDSCIRNLNDNSPRMDNGFSEELIRNKYTKHVSEFDLLLDLFEKVMYKLKKSGKFG